MRKGRQLLALFLALVLLLTSCGGGTKAASMHLRKTEGRVSVSDDGGKDVEPKENLGLYSGYGVDTRKESYAWIDLDKVKLTKLDQDSEIEITKEGKDLEIEVKAGSLFFNVTEPLASDETMEIRASSMLVGIRGTCGWVALSENGDQFSVYLLEGKVRCEADGEKETVRAGEMAVMTEDGEITVEKFTAADVPAFVAEEVEDDDDLLDAILDDSGIDMTGGTSSSDLDDYADILDRIRDEGYEVLHAEVLDFEADGKPELLVIVNQNSNGMSDYDYIMISICRKDTRLINFSTSSYNTNGIGITSLVEYGDRLFVRIQRTQTYSNTPGSFHTETSYIGSVAQEEGSQEDWGFVDVFEYSQNGSEVHCSRRLHDERGFPGTDQEELTTGEFAAAQAQYKELKVLVYYTSDRGFVVLPDPSEIEPPAEPGLADPGPAEPQQPEEPQPDQTGEAPSDPPADIWEQYRAIIQQAGSYEYDVWPAGANEGLRYTLFQEDGFTVPTLILEKLGLDRHGFLLFRYNPDTGTTEQVGSDSITRFEFPSHAFINNISYEEWHNTTDTSALDAWASKAP